MAFNYDQPNTAYIGKLKGTANNTVQPNTAYIGKVKGTATHSAAKHSLNW